MTKIAVGLVAAVILGLVASFLLPWQKVNWGRFQILPGKTITVIGQADSREKNQIARFSTGVNVTNDGKEKAIEEVSQKMAKIIDSVKDFGIAAEDIKTQNMSIYQEEERYWEEGREKSRPGQWRVSNQIDITLRDVNRTSALADLLAKSGANNVYGPNLGFEDTKHIEAGLLEKAIEDAR